MNAIGNPKTDFIINRNFELHFSVTYETTISYDGVHDHNIAQLRKFKANPAAANMKVTTILIRLDDESEFELIEKAESGFLCVSI